MSADRGNWFQTASGRVFFPSAPKAAEIFLFDIARGLSMQCRFNGQVDHYYSVAEHSRHVSLRVAPVEELDILARASSPVGKKAYEDLVGLGLVGLLHDAGEAYLGDMVGPVKHAKGMEGYRELERVLDAQIWERFDLWAYARGAASASSEVGKAVKLADIRMVLTEKRDLRQPPRHQTPAWREEQNGYLPYDDMKIRGEDPETAERLFVERFQELWERKTGAHWDDDLWEAADHPAVAVDPPGPPDPPRPKNHEVG